MSIWLIMVMMIAYGGFSRAATVVDNELLAREPSGANWAGYGRTFDEQRYSPLTQINEHNVGRLGLIWTLDLPDTHSVTTVPLAVDGVIYFAAGYTVVHAVDARTGKLLWRYDSEATKLAGHKMRGSWGIRGLAFWRGRVYAGTVDGRLIAVDAKTGKLAWSTMTVGKNDNRYITGAPKVFNGLVVIGHGGADYGPVRGYVTAYDAETGVQRWRFYTVPGNPADGFENKAMEMAAKTWTGEWWKHGGGGTVWNAMTYDPEFNRIYLGTGNGAPWNQKIRSPGGGDNLFLCSVVALDADTGEYVWHYQTNPGETWDYNSAMDMVLADLTIEGKARKVMLHAPKNGFFYVIDRETGKLISAEKIAKVTWAERIDLATGRPVENPEARYPNGEATVWPGNKGAHSWYPMAFNPNTGLVYVPVWESSTYYNDQGVDLGSWKHPAGFSFSSGLASGKGKPGPPDPVESYLLAWNPVTQRSVWRVPTPWGYNSGVTTSAGNLVFQANADGKLRIYAADNGKELGAFELGVGTLSPPITYIVDGRQYVSILAGWLRGIPMKPIVEDKTSGWWSGREQPRRLLTFAIDGKADLPSPPRPAKPIPLDDLSFTPEPEKVEVGAKAYGRLCQTCHGAAAVSGGYIPDLRASPIPMSLDALRQVVQQGALRSRGMPMFDDITEKDLIAIRHYLRARARESLAQGHP
ncbi:PQQ-dependent dehydrogenase, methanol/ethanol family [Denitratisoma oestradiolicum]|uniref:PQQ-dependent dehydrogenase, methanol/ethanol family n=1 Tax=Denitratisoma oestradiolicum TaxID=311182 RepID=UPI001476D865|nr:PQQ-dependent dehydrogenase, methanol/ethanol family [Denitratisoma oestradiolicum]